VIEHRAAAKCAQLCPRKLACRGPAAGRRAHSAAGGRAGALRGRCADCIAAVTADILLACCCQAEQCLVVCADGCGLQEPDGTGGGRTVLWAGKLKHRAAGAAGVSTVELLTLSAAVPEVWARPLRTQGCLQVITRHRKTSQRTCSVGQFYVCCRRAFRVFTLQDAAEQLPPTLFVTDLAQRGSVRMASHRLVQCRPGPLSARQAQKLQARRSPAS